jgi:hypothetical protein
MTKFSLGADHGYDRPHTAGTDGLLPPTQRDATLCDLYAPGHQIHYKHQGDAVRSPSELVRDTLVDGTRLTLLLDDGRELTWRHHDPARLRRILELLRGRCLLYPAFHALRVGPYWFNCAAESDDWQDCRLSLTGTGDPTS